jgi:hypothetical protein
MVSDEEFVSYFLRRGILQPSIDRVRHKFPRWRTRLATMGVHDLDPLVPNKVMNLVINQESPVSDRETKHRLRNESGIRPPKP